MESLENRKNSLCGHLLVKASRLFFTKSVRRVIEACNLNISEHHFRVFPYLKYGGSTITEISSEMGISKQAVSKLVSQLAQEGIVFLEVSKTDRREKIVKFSTNKGSSFDWSLNQLESLDKNFEKILGGKEELNQFKESLLKIQQYYEE